MTGCKVCRIVRSLMIVGVLVLIVVLVNLEGMAS